MERKPATQKAPFEFISKTITLVRPSSGNGHCGTTSTWKLLRPLSVTLQTPPSKVNPDGRANVTVKSPCWPGRVGFLRTGMVGSIVILLSPSGWSQERSRNVAG